MDLSALGILTVVDALLLILASSNTAGGVNIPLGNGAVLTLTGIAKLDLTVVDFGF